ncbi:transcription antitermination factor NusB [Sphingomicrobium sp. XHP0239]|uniref:RsmB/NOP family class I SAM-dependent RNA methyltransferase n=1 Tax=Sphingomicrobium maritimum TaxID=3133972 RepID=UPI0031CCB6E1
MPRPSNDGSGEGTVARAAALKLLDAVLRRDETLDHAAHHATRGLPPSDAGLALAIAGETLRRLSDLDALIDSVMDRPLPDDAKARMVLRMALAQRIALGTPDHAVVATALPQVAGGPRRLVHGVLSRLLKSDLPPLNTPRLPAAIEERWAHWGDDVITAARMMVGQRPPLDISLKHADAAAPEGPSLAPLHRRVTSGDAVTGLPGFDAGGWWVQDLAASLPARLIPSSARRVLDACAAPGGKTMQLAAAGHDVTALDLSAKRLRVVEENLARTDLSARIVAHDLRHHRDDPFDAVLLDAPCSATGTFRRHPEVLYRARPGIVSEMAALQSSLLDASARLTGPGGSLVYATCSLEPEEGEEQMVAFLDRTPGWRIEPAHVPVDAVAPTEEGWLRILPGALADAGSLDGFFIAHLVRAGD